MSRSYPKYWDRQSSANCVIPDKNVLFVCSCSCLTVTTRLITVHLCKSLFSLYIIGEQLIFTLYRLVNVICQTNTKKSHMNRVMRKGV